MSQHPVVYCDECRHSKPDPNAGWSLRCHNPNVNRENPWALASPNGSARGSECTDERRKTGWFSVCGIKGKQYEAKQ